MSLFQYDLQKPRISYHMREAMHDLDRSFVKVARVAVTAGDGVGVIVNWQNPEDEQIVILGGALSVTTAATGACTVDIGVDDDGADSDDTLLDGQDVNAATGVFPFTAGALLPAAEYVVLAEASGDVTGLVGVLYIEYQFAADASY